VVPLPYTDTRAAVAFYGTVGAFVLLEQRIRWRSRRNRQGARADRGSLVVVIAAVAAGGVGAFLAASDLTGAAIGRGRWPVFVGGLVLMWAGNWASLAVLAVVPTVGLVVRIRVEERVLSENLGEPYRRFAATRPRLFPGLW
jgi:protein-S-isoprenylcysteine O-methyltransferase Ste14